MLYPELRRYHINYEKEKKEKKKEKKEKEIGILEVDKQ